MLPKITILGVFERETNKIKRTECDLQKLHGPNSYNNNNNNDDDDDNNSNDNNNNNNNNK